MSLPKFRALAERVGAAEALVPAAVDRIAAAARAAGLPIASHDDDSIGARNAHRARGGSDSANSRRARTSRRRRGPPAIGW